MQEISVTLETVTPLFLGGAEAKREPPELRPPAFRGAMRYWFRATLGGVIGDKNLTDLHKLETAVFGSPDTSSPISIILSGNPSHSPYSILPHKPGGKRDAFDSVEQFQLTLRAKASMDKLIWVNACMALNLTLLFGGVGLRSRRGFGSLRVFNSADKSLIPLTPSSVTDEKWEKHIKGIAMSAIERARQLAENMSVPIKGLPSSPTNYPCAAQGGLVRIVKFDRTTPEDAVKDMMSVMPQVNYLGGIKPRQSSPLWVRVFWADKKYHLLMCLLPSKLARKAENYTSVKEFLDNRFRGTDLSIQGWNV